MEVQLTWQQQEAKKVQETKVRNSFWISLFFLLTTTFTVLKSAEKEEYLKTLKEPDNIYFQFRYNSLYDWHCEELKKVDLLYDKSYLIDNKPYLYGSKWLNKELPIGIIEEIKELIKNN